MGCPKLKNNITRVNQSGFVFNVRIDRAYQDIKIINEVIAGDTYELRELSKIFKKAELILDIGGHIGTFGIFAKSLWPKARIIALEPDEMSAELYRRNLIKNYPSDKDSIVIQKAISYDEEKRFIISSNYTTGGKAVVSRDMASKHRKAEPIKFDGNYKEVETTTIEQVIEKHGIKKIDIAKWDCEGCEIDAFKNMPLETKKKFCFMVGEVHAEKDFYPPKLFGCKLMWPRIKRWFPTHFFDWRLANGLMNRTLFKAFPK